MNEIVLEKVGDEIQYIHACAGDSGGPFVVRHPLNENKFLQIGKYFIISFA
jgi:hypothetical protein